MLNGQWRATRADGQTTVFEAESEREATLLARESWGSDSTFTLTLVGRSCPQCGATFGPEVKGCPACKARRDERKRPYLATVMFLLKGGWTRPHEARVRAMGIVGATAVAVREAKRAVVKPRARIAEMKVSVVPVRK